MRKSSNERLSGGSAGKTSADAPFTQQLILFLCGNVSKTSIPSALRRHSNNDWQSSRWPKLKKCSFICCTCPEPSKRTIATMSVSESVNCVPWPRDPTSSTLVTFTVYWGQGSDVSLTNWQRSFSICTLNALGHGGSSSMTQVCWTSASRRIPKTCSSCMLESSSISLQILETSADNSGLMLCFKAGMFHGSSISGRKSPISVGGLFQPSFEKELCAIGYGPNSKVGRCSTNVGESTVVLLVGWTFGIKKWPWDAKVTLVWMHDSAYIVLCALISSFNNSGPILAQSCLFLVWEP